MNMQSYTPDQYETRPAVDRAFARFLSTTYAWMAGGLAISATVAYFVANTPAVRNILFSNGITLLLLCLAQFALIGVFVSKVTTLAPTRAAALFMGYAALSGATLSSLLLYYTRAALTQAFGVTALSFAALAAYGTLTKRDLGAWRQFLFVGLVGVVVAQLISAFFHTPGLDFMATCAGVVVFAGLTAYDHHKLRQMFNMTGGYGNLAINGALMLYLDFLNLFLMLLRFSDNRRR